ncbi:hypothetical protein D3C77_322690 [compost metagenome]
MIVGQLLGLLVDRLGHFSAAVTNVHAVQAGKGIDQLPPLVIAQTDALGTGNDPPLERTASVIMGVG